MKLFTKDIDYSIRALCFMDGRKDQKISAKDLSKNTKIPQPFVRKILQRLNKNGFIVSYKGKNGGFVLHMNPSSIKIIEIIRAFQGEITLMNHVFKKRACSNIKKCVLKKKFDKIEKFIVSELNAINLADIIKSR